MEKEFVPYKLALKLQELGFKESCFGMYCEGKFYELYPHCSDYYPKDVYREVDAPTFSQAFRWFREKYIIHSWISSIIDPVGFVYEYRVHIHQEESSVENFDSFEVYKDAELFCLEKLIEIVEKQYF